MRNLLLAKRADLYLQLLSLVTPVAWIMLTDIGQPFFVVYFSVGTVQVISCIVNKASLPVVYRNSSRTFYERTLLTVVALVATAAICAFGSMEGRGGDILFVVLFVLLLVSPLMAVWYMLMTWEELRSVRDFKQSQH